MMSPRKQLWRATQKQSADFRRAKARAFTVLPPFRELLCNSSLPPMRLNPDGSWMQLLARTTAEEQSAHRGQGLDRPPLPYDAHIDFQLMRVRIPIEYRRHRWGFARLKLSAQPRGSPGSGRRTLEIHTPGIDTAAATINKWHMLASYE